MVRWLCALIAGCVVSGFAVLLVTGEYANDGQVVLAFSQDHGLHAGDLFVIAAWLVALLALAGLVLSGRRRRDGLSRGARLRDTLPRTGQGAA